MDSNKVLVVFDYDWSLINTNSDTYVVEALGPELYPLFREYRDQGLGWTATMDAIMGKLHERGVTPDQIREALAAVPVQEGMLEAAALAAERG
eukprot:CAMPEP_0206399868 /NCGR_PEP_ID=MMETSP0294-20121207/25130_1 /ASSEMBLY_ACC=CAM_ASM_000327 /TAXON_ID=39354 /ORGANISM="Heterosigma akashiwo, Strain CCMP2393" /LENGTH=92 /DNA_ID=CAMNT_0053855859 /DNA_START=261 /DNA_END=535 /DNA_ORIENTATION=+